MRIVGGMWRGRAIEAPKGRATRPTTDRMRETIASMVMSAQGLDLTDDVVLDAFAGSGGVGLELLSRGARSCTFCEKDRRTAALVRANCRGLGVAGDACHIVVGDVMKVAEAGGPTGGPFSVVFLDPPYAMPAEDVAALVRSLDIGGLLADGCLVVYERASNAAALEFEGATTLRTRKHGSTCVDLLRMGG